LAAKTQQDVHKRQDRPRFNVKPECRSLSDSMLNGVRYKKLETILDLKFPELAKEKNNGDIARA
jgi:hypothetical protein